MEDVADFDLGRYESFLISSASQSSGPYNLSSLDFASLNVNRVKGRELQPLTKERAKSLIQKAYPKHFHQGKDLDISISLTATPRTVSTLFFAFIVEHREANWRSSDGVTREFDAVFNALDKWTAHTPPIVLDSANSRKIVELPWVQTGSGQTSPIKTHCLCWEHSSDCQSCRGIVSIDTCFVCRGKGIFKKTQCQMCSSNGKYWCKVCSNTGKVACMVCRSTNEPGLIELSAFIKTKRETRITEPSLYHNTTVVKDEAQKAVQTLDDNAAVVAMVGIIADWDAQNVRISDGENTELYEIAGYDCQHIVQPSKPASSSRPSYFTRNVSSRIGRLALKTSSS